MRYISTKHSNFACKKYLHKIRDAQEEDAESSKTGDTPKLEMPRRNLVHTLVFPSLSRELIDAYCLKPNFHLPLQTFQIMEILVNIYLVYSQSFLVS